MLTQNFGGKIFQFSYFELFNGSGIKIIFEIYWLVKYKPEHFPFFNSERLINKEQQILTMLCSYHHAEMIFLLTLSVRMVVYDAKIKVVDVLFWWNVSKE